MPKILPPMDKADAGNPCGGGIARDDGCRKKLSENLVGDPCVLF